MEKRRVTVPGPPTEPSGAGPGWRATEHDAPPIRIRDLSDEQQLVVWSARVWVDRRAAGLSPVEEIERMHALAGIPEAARAATALFDLLATGARRPIDVGCPTCPTLHAHEALLINALWAYQVDRPQLAACVLGHLLERDAGFRAIGPAQRWALALGSAGLVLASVVPDPPRRSVTPDAREANGSPTTAVRPTHPAPSRHLH